MPYSEKYQFGASVEIWPDDPSPKNPTPKWNGSGQEFGPAPIFMYKFPKAFDTHHEAKVDAMKQLVEQARTQLGQLEQTLEAFKEGKSSPFHLSAG